MPLWERVAVPDSEMIDFVTGPHWGAVAFGSIGGKAAFLMLDREGVERAVRPGVDRPISSAVSNGDEYYLVVGRTSPELRSMFLPIEETGNAHMTPAEGAARAWVVAPDEDTLTLYASAEGVLGLSNYDAPEEFDPPLRLVGDVNAVDVVLRGFGEAGVCVAGPLMDGAGRTALAWVSGDGEWEPVGGSPATSTVTDMYDVSRGAEKAVWIAGHHDLRPIIQDSDGRLLEVPECQLDPASPTVLLVDGVNAIAVQTAAGPQLWSRPPGTDPRQVADGQLWLVEELPPGRISAGYRSERYGDERPEIDDRLFVVIDGQVWHRPLEADHLA